MQIVAALRCGDLYAERAYMHFVEIVTLAKKMGVTDSSLRRAIKSGVLTPDTTDYYGRPAVGTSHRRHSECNHAAPPLASTR
jgi:hypothetical protein